LFFLFFLFAESEVFAVRIGDKSRLFERETIIGSDQVFGNVDSDYVGEKHIVRSEFYHFGHATFDRNGTLVYHRRGHLGRGNGGQFAEREFVYVPPRADSAEVCRPCERISSEIYHKFTALRYYPVRISAFAKRNIGLWRLRTDNSRPCDGDYIRLFQTAAAYHYAGHRREKRASLP